MEIKLFKKLILSVVLSKFKNVVLTFSEEFGEFLHILLLSKLWEQLTFQMEQPEQNSESLRCVFAQCCVLTVRLEKPKHS